MKYQLAIIGGGPAGYTAAEMAGKAGLSVVLFEKNNVGGVCLNEGCIPTKTLLYSAKVHDMALHASKYGVSVQDVSVDLGKIVARKTKVVRKLVMGIKAKLTAQHVMLVQGEAYIQDAHTVCCNEEVYECDYLMVCTGSTTFVPSIPGLDTVNYWTHREALENKEIPSSLVIVGGGVIGMEFASFFNSLGVKVTVIEMMDEILGGIDKELAGLLRMDYAKKGVKFLLGAKVTQIAQSEETVEVSYTCGEDKGSVCAEKLLMSVGRRPVMTGFGLENLHLELTNRGTVKVNEYLQSSVPGVYVCGDLNGVSLLAHTAVREAEVAVHHLLGEKDTMSYRAIPGVVYTNPEVASVGLTEEALKQEGRAYKVLRLPAAYSGRFVAENEGVNGICKVLVGEDEEILGVHLLGNPASELIIQAGMMIEDRRKLAEWKKYVFPHPTVGEIFREL